MTMVYTMCAMLLMSLTLNGCSKKKDETKLVNAEDVQKCAHPWQVRLEACGGTLIDKKWVLTSAKCVEQKIDTVWVGDWDAVKKDEHEKEIKVKQTYRHEGYNKCLPPRANDMALLELEEEVTLNDCVDVLPLAKQATPEDSTVKLAGWGRNSAGADENILQEAEFTTMSHSVCAEKYTEFKNTSVGGWLKGDIPERMRCATGNVNINTGKRPDACDGDLGGPITKDKTLIGVISWGACGKLESDDPVPVVYEQIIEHREWIKKVQEGGKPPANYSEGEIIEHNCNVDEADDEDSD